MLRPSIISLVILASYGGATGCGGTQKGGTKGGLVEAREAVPLKREACEDGQEQLTDVNGDGYANVRNVVDGGRKICSELDLNMDRRVDLMRTFDKNGQVAFEQYDLDFDGRLDLQTYFEAGKLARKELDTNFDRMVDTWIFCEGDLMKRVERDRRHRGNVDSIEEYQNGLLQSARYDDNNDGRSERWEIFRSGRLVKVDYDTDMDGKPDRSSTDITSSAAVPQALNCDGRPLAAREAALPAAAPSTNAAPAAPAAPEPPAPPAPSAPAAPAPAATPATSGQPQGATP